VYYVSALVEDGIVKLIVVEEGGLGVTCTAAVPMLNEVKVRDSPHIAMTTVLLCSSCMLSHYAFVY
jgi:hypothetical protein